MGVMKWLRMEDGEQIEPYEGAFLWVYATHKFPNAPSRDHIDLVLTHIRGRVAGVPPGGNLPEEG